MNILISLLFLSFIFLISFLPMIGAYVGFLQVANNDNNKWQEENKDAYLIHNGR
jgi:hypothetical protein